MCGIFGAYRNGASSLPEKVIGPLGWYAMSRGRDSAGLVGIGPTSSGNVLPPEAHRTARLNGPGLRLRKTLGPFSGLVGNGALRDAVSDATAVLGHTRRATQGEVSMLNAAPLLAGTLVGIHNGDVDRRTPELEAQRDAVVGQTDSELIYAALNVADGDIAAIADTLANLRGRAALAWVDRREPGRLWLARAALSPLVITYDTDGNLYFASSPDWFAPIATTTGVQFAQPWYVAEGTLLAITTRAGQIHVDVHERFEATCRARDERLARPGYGGPVYRGWSDRHAAVDRAGWTHRTVGSCPPLHQDDELQVAR